MPKRSLPFCAAIVMLLAAPLAGANVTWTLPPNQSGDWSLASNWTAGLPTSSSTAYIVNGGTATITLPGAVCGTLSLGNSAGAGTIQMTGGSLSATCAYVGYSGIGSFTQSGGTSAIGNSNLYLGYNTGGNGTYSLSGGSLSAPSSYVGYSGTGSFTQSGGTSTIRNSLYLGYNSAGNGIYGISGGSLSVSSAYVGYSGAGSFTQSGGTNTISNSLDLGYNSGASGTYSLSNGLLSVPNVYVSYSGAGSFTQSGGTDTISSSLYVGCNSGSTGTYALGGGLLSAANEYIGPSGQALFQQTGGVNTTSYLSIAGTQASYRLNGGTLNVQCSLVNQGVFDGGGGTGSLNVTSGIFDLSQGTLQNVGAMSVSVDGNSLLIVPAGFNPATGFGSLNSSGLIHNAGTTLLVPAAQGFSGQGSIVDPVVCQGTIAAVSGGGSINLGNGLSVSGTAKVRLVAAA